MWRHVEIAARCAIEPADTPMMVNKIDADAFFQSDVSLNQEFRCVAVIPIPDATTLSQRSSVRARIVSPQVLRLGQVAIGKQNAICVRGVRLHGLNPITMPF